MDNNKRAYGPPPHDVEGSKKAQNKWGLQGAKWIWFQNDSFAPTLFYNDRDTYEKYIKYAFGEQSEENYKPALGLNPQNMQHSFLGGIRWQIKNFATKRINQTISKVYNRQYDPSAKAVDPVSIDRKESFKASLKMWMDHQAWLSERQSMIGMDMSPMEMDSLPLNDEELEIYIQNDYKLNYETDLELGIKHHTERIDFELVKEKIDFYLTVLPVAGVWTGLGADNLPIVKILNPARILSPRSEFNDFKRLAYCACVDDYTVAEFKQLPLDGLSQVDIKDIIDRHAVKNNYYRTTYNSEFPESDRDVDKIQVMHFEISTVNELVYLERKDKHGNDRFVEKPYDYYRTKEEMDKFRSKYKTERKIHRVPYPTVYGGYWVVGTDYVFGYGEKNYLGGKLGYTLRASNMHDGRATSLMKQMIPSLDLLETYDKKIQQLVASAIPKGVFIDLFALRKAKFKMSGKDMQIGDLINMFFQRGILIGDSNGEYKSGSTQKPVFDLENGMSQDLAQYLSLMKHELEVLDEVIGYNRVSAASTLSPETGARVATMMDRSTDTALDHIYRADRGIVKDIYSNLAALHMLSVKTKPEYYIPIFGREAVNRMIMADSYVSMGIDIEARPTQEEWDQLYEELNEMAATGAIKPEDKIKIRRASTLKQAQSLLLVATRRQRKEMMDAQQALSEQNAKVQQESNTQASQNTMMQKQFERETDVILENIKMKAEREKHQYKMEEIALQNTLMNEGKVETAKIGLKKKAKASS